MSVESASPALPPALPSPAARATRPGQARFDPLDPGFLDDPYPYYERLREAGPIVRDGAAQWVAARHEAVARLLREPRLRSEWPEPFQRLRIGDGAAKDFLLNVLLHREGADHELLRRLLNATLRTTTGEQVEAVVVRVTDEALGRGFAGERLDVMADLAMPVPVAVACEMIGVPAADRPLVQTWGEEIIKAFTVMLPEPDRPAVADAVSQLRAYLEDRLSAPAGPDDRLASAMAIMSGDGGGPFSREQLVDNLIFLLVSGFTTTVHVVAAVGAVLLSRPDVVADLRADASLVPGAVEEFLRYDAPIQHVSRFAAEPVVVAGTTIRPGRIVHLLLGSANRDPRRFERPDVLDVRRSPNPHLSFGAGMHMCLGAGLGRLEATALLRHLLLRCRAVEPAGAPQRRPVQVFRTYARLPCTVLPA